MTPQAKVAVAFATALVDGDFARAHEFLTPSLQQQLMPESLREKLYAMFRSYADSEPKNIHYDEEFSDLGWPGEFPGHVGDVYVGIEGDDFIEAVAVTVMDIEGDHLISQIIWGRP